MGNQKKNIISLFSNYFYLVFGLSCRFYHDPTNFLEKKKKIGPGILLAKLCWTYCILIWHEGLIAFGFDMTNYFFDGVSIWREGLIAFWFDIMDLLHFDLTRRIIYLQGSIWHEGLIAFWFNIMDLSYFDLTLHLKGIFNSEAMILGNFWQLHWKGQCRKYYNPL